MIYPNASHLPLTQSLVSKASHLTLRPYIVQYLLSKWLVISSIQRFHVYYWTIHSANHLSKGHAFKLCHIFWNIFYHRVSRLPLLHIFCNIFYPNTSHKPLKHIFNKIFYLNASRLPFPQIFCTKIYRKAWHLPLYHIFCNIFYPKASRLTMPYISQYL